MSAPALRTGVIVGSTRPHRFADTVVRWFSYRAVDRPDLALDLIDLAAVDLPPVARMPGRLDVTPGLAAFTERIRSADAFVVVTPEYNHSFPAALKHAIDLVHAEWARKPVGFVSYGGVSGGLRAVEHLRGVFAELRATTIRETVSLALMRDQFDEAGRLADPDGPNVAVDVMLDELVWWGQALRAARVAEPVAW